MTNVNPRGWRGSGDVSKLTLIDGTMVLNDLTTQI